MLLFYFIFIIFFRYKTMFCTYPNCILQSSNYFILDFISSAYFKSFLLSKIIQSAQNNIQKILFSYKQWSPNIQEITQNSRLQWVGLNTVVIQLVSGEIYQSTFVSSMFECVLPIPDNGFIGTSNEDITLKEPYYCLPYYVLVKIWK